MARFRDVSKPPAGPVLPKFESKGSGKAKTYLWTTDANGNLKKMEASTVKKSFGTLSYNDRVALDTYLISTGKTPTDTLRKTLWGIIVDGAVADYKTGKQGTPWDVLGIMQSQAPGNIVNTSYVGYDKTSADATLNIVAKNLGFDTTQLTDADRNEFATAIAEEAKNSGKVIQKTASTGGMETVTTPSTFDAKTFAENWLWAKVNIGDTTKLPAKALTALTSVKSILASNGINYLGDKEINQLAVDLAHGTTNEAQLKTDYATKAAANYPQLADRILKNPGQYTVADLITPYTAAVAKYWEVDPATVSITDPVIDKAIRPDGTAGKLPMQSLADFITTLKNSPEAEKTSWAIDGARNAATGLARAMGFGV